MTGFELIHRMGFEFLAETGFDLCPPFAAEWSVLVEISGPMGPEDALAEAMEAGLVVDAVIAQNEAQRAHFWALRESIPEANKRVGSISSHDISVPVSAVPAFIARAAAAVPAGLRVNCFGHMGDGNLHYNVFPPKGKIRSDYAGQRADIARTIFDIVAEFGGSFSAEHGVGRLKVDDLERYGDAGQLKAMHRIKAALDPVGIMNPGAVLRG